METLKILLAMVLLCIVAPAMAQDRGFDSYSYQSNPQCQFKITLRTGLTTNLINYQLTYNGATPKEGAVGPNDVVEMRLPLSHQWYDLRIERDEADKALYTLVTDPGCNNPSASAVFAPTPVLTEDKWNAAQAKLMIFVQQAQGTSSALPVAGSSSCTISTRSGSIRMRAGHSTNDAVVGNLPPNVQLQVIDRFLEPVGRTTRTWYRLVKEEVAPTSDAAEVWVGGTVRTAGNCVNITASASGNTGSGPAASAVPPQTGNWTWTVGNTVNVACNSVGSADYSTDVGQMSFGINIANSANSFTFNGVDYSQDANGTWHAYYAAPSAQATGNASLRVDNSTSILGDIVVSLADVPECTFKIPFWANPR